MFEDDNRDINPSQPLSLGDALLLGTRLHRLSQLDEAEVLYRAVLEAVPEHALALQFLGILEHQRHHSELALSYMQRALAQQPEAPGLHQNLGNMLLEQQRFDEAAAAYERCVQLGGKTAELLSNIGVLHRQSGRHDAAEAAYREAIALDPTYAESYHGYGRLLAQQGRNKEACTQYMEALTRDPALNHSRRHLGLALCVLGRVEEAAQVHRDWLAVEPDNPMAKHYLAACTGEGVPDRASDAYVSAMFDKFAQSFDAQLEVLQYRAPALVGAAVQRLLGEPKADLDVLDAGCGTGLCAPMLAPFARRLVGVDLSSGMLARAEARGGYDALHEAELTAFMRAHEGAFGLIVSADTLCYFGELEAACRTTFAALEPGARFVFTVEALADAQGSADPRFKLNPAGRYSHARGYVQRALSDAGFGELAMEDVVLRNEAAEPVRGYLVTCRRPTA